MEDVVSETSETDQKGLSFWGLIAGALIFVAAVSQILSGLTFLYETYTFKNLSAGLLTQPSVRWLGEGLYVPFHAVASLYAAVAHLLFGGFAFVVPYELSEFSLTTLTLVCLFVLIFLRFYGRPLRRGLLFWALTASIVCLSLYALDGVIYRSLSWTSIAVILIFISNYILMLLVMRYGAVPVVAHPKISTRFSNGTSVILCLVFLASTTLIIFSVWHSYWRAGLLPFN
jgi:hypothetical protein